MKDILKLIEPKDEAVEKILAPVEAIERVWSLIPRPEFQNMYETLGDGEYSSCISIRSVKRKSSACHARSFMGRIEAGTQIKYCSFNRNETRAPRLLVAEYICQRGFRQCTQPIKTKIGVNNFLKRRKFSADLANVSVGFLRPARANHWTWGRGREGGGKS